MDLGRGDKIRKVLAILFLPVLMLCWSAIAIPTEIKNLKARRNQHRFIAEYEEASDSIFTKLKNRLKDIFSDTIKITEYGFREGYGVNHSVMRRFKLRIGQPRVRLYIRVFEKSPSAAKAFLELIASFIFFVVWIASIAVLCAPVWSISVFEWIISIFR